MTTATTGTALGISVVNTFELTVINNLSLVSGDLRLTGEAQLIQQGAAANPGAGTGKILCDQQGKKNSFNYNYWSSPVTTNNINYSISGVLRDGTNVATNPFSPGIITFGNGSTFADGAATSPIKISNRWLYSYNSPTPGTNTDLQNYNQWNPIGNAGILKAGEGFTMKGTDGTVALAATQNYVFVGKPNSGDITLSLPLVQSYLIGNPYPSALDADKFIRDNLKDCVGCTNSANVFNGALYFWDHFGLTSNHLLAQYVGGYATYTLTGGVVGIANEPLTANTGASGANVPRQYIPVAQGFFVDAALDAALGGSSTTVQGGTLVFKNSQRAFIREGLPNSIFMKTSATAKTEAAADTRSKIRLGFDSPTGSHRQLLLGADSNASSNFDIGYDAPMFDLSSNDMYWELINIPFVIQAVANFNEDQIIPIGINIANQGSVAIKIDALENISDATQIYLYDNLNSSYHDIRNSAFSTVLEVGKYNNRFSMRFSNKTLSLQENNLNDGITVLYSNNYKYLIIENKTTNTTITKVHLFNLLGQAVANWDIENTDQTKIQIPVKNTSSGIYIVKLQTSRGVINQKIIIK